MAHRALPPLNAVRNVAGRVARRHDPVLLALSWGELSANHRFIPRRSPSRTSVELRGVGMCHVPVDDGTGGETFNLPLLSCLLGLFSTASSFSLALIDALRGILTASFFLSLRDIYNSVVCFNREDADNQGFKGSNTNTRQPRTHSKPATNPLYPPTPRHKPHDDNMIPPDAPQTPPCPTLTRPHSWMQHKLQIQTCFVILLQNPFDPTKPPYSVCWGHKDPLKDEK